jgi:hypothetical protein
MGILDPQKVLNWLAKSYKCPYFWDVPGSEKDFDLVLPHWTACDHEDECLDKDKCPVLTTPQPHFKSKE